MDFRGINTNPELNLPKLKKIHYSKTTDFTWFLLSSQRRNKRDLEAFTNFTNTSQKLTYKEFTF